MSTVQPLSAVPDFSDSRTFSALRSACIGEMHARRLYRRCAQLMEEAGLQVIAHAFIFTAAQEKEHAAVFRGLIAAHGGPDVPPAEDAPLLLPRQPLEILRAVAQSEQDECDMLYPHNVRIAAEEGYPRIAHAFRRIAENERLHAQRFQQYAQALLEGRLFRAENQTTWFCLACGQLHTGQDAPQSCSGCGRSQGHFIRSSYFPFSIEG